MADGEILKRVEAGQELGFIPRRTFNAFVDTANLVRGMARSPRAPTGQIRFTVSQTVVMVYNDEESTDVDRFGILELDGLAIEPKYAGDDNLHNFLDQPVFKGYVPGYNAHFGWWCVTLEPIKHGECGRAIVDGWTYAKIRKPDQITDEEPFRFAEIDDGEHQFLRAANGGQAAILWVDDSPIETDGDVYWGIIDISPHTAPQLYAELTEALDYGNNGGDGAEATLYYQKYLEGDSTHGSLVSTGKKCIVFAPLLNSGKRLASGVRVKVSPNVQSGLFNADDANACETPIPP